MVTNSIPPGRTLTDTTLEQYADEIAGVLAAWGMTLPDAYRCIRTLKYRLQNWPRGTWVNPIEGTGYKADQAIEGGLMINDGEGEPKFGPLGTENNLN